MAIFHIKALCTFMTDVTKFGKVSRHPQMKTVGSFQVGAIVTDS